MKALDGWENFYVIVGSSAGKGIAVTLIRDVGFDPIDLGSLKSARYT
jgi:predicted dinucleotide-binding enzyme